MQLTSNLFQTTYKKDIPLLCTFEITQKCNLRCQHCYIDFSDAKKHRKPELKTHQVKKILKDLAKNGVLYLVFTGGEPFLRPDLLELCTYARKLKFDLRIFTNGTLISEAAARKLSQINISAVEISLYGRKDTHDKITGMPDSFDRVLDSIKLLKKHGIRVTIKCPLMKTNFKDYTWLQMLSKRLRVKLHFDPTITPKNNGDKSILRYRLNSGQLETIYKKLMQQTGAGQWTDKKRFPISTCEAPLSSSSASKRGGKLASSNDLFCSAAHNLLAIGFEGTVYPCLQLPLQLGNLKKTSLTDIWDNNNKYINQYRKINTSDLKRCSTCKINYFCQRCPGLALIEDRNLYGPSKIACQIAKVIKKSTKFYCDKSHKT